MSIDFKNMLGRTIESVALNQEKTEVRFAFADGFVRSFGVEGDCCSRSWIEEVDQPPAIAGAKLLFVTDGGRCHDGTEITEEDADPCIKVYNVVFVTDRGRIILEFRNESNGYYGGSLVDVEAVAR